MRSRTCGKDGGAGVPSGTLNAPLGTFRDSKLGQRGGKERRAMGPSLWAGFEPPNSYFRFRQRRVGGLIFNTKELCGAGVWSAQSAQVVTDCVPVSGERSRETQWCAHGLPVEFQRAQHESSNGSTQREG